MLGYDVADIARDTYFGGYHVEIVLYLVVEFSVQIYLDTSRHWSIYKILLTETAVALTLFAGFRSFRG